MGFQGWCVGHSHRESINGNAVFSDGATHNILTYRYCKEDCGAARWNGQEPTACEWSSSEKTCNVFWGGNVDASRSGSNYECYLVNKPKAESNVGTTYVNGEKFSSLPWSEAETSVGLRGRHQWEETNVGGVAGGLSHPHETWTAQYKDYFSDGGKCNGDGQYTWTGKMSYESCDLACLKSHCQSLGRVTSYGDSTTRMGKIFACCTTGGEEAAAVAMQTSISTEDWAVYGFAVIGIGALAHMAYKKVTQKSHETTPIYQEV